MSTQRPERDILMAYIDGQLDAGRHTAVQRVLDTDPTVASEVHVLQAQVSALRSALDPVLEEPVPVRLLQRAAPPRRDWPRAMAAALWVGIGLTTGVVATTTWRADPIPARLEQVEGLGHFVQQAQVAYAVYTPDARRPVEVRQASVLVTWLSRRLDRPIVAPDALPGGLLLIGGRLLPGMPGRPAAQLMYQDSQGRRVTIYLRAMLNPTARTAFRIIQSGSTTTLYWVDRNWGYALTGEIPRETLVRVAKALYRSYEHVPTMAPAPQHPV